MRKKFLSALLLCCMVLTLLPTAALADGDVVINETNFPDENFRQYGKTEFDTKNADGPAAPVLSLVSRTDKDIKVTENDKWEYSIDNGESWQRSCHFTGLQPGTVYTIIARVQGTATQNPGAVSEPLIVTTMHTEISPELKKQLRAVVSAYIAEYDGMKHEAVIVDMSKMPEGWRIAGYTTDGGSNYSDSMPTIKNVGTLWVGVKFVHPDYIANITNFYTAEVTAKRLTLKGWGATPTRPSP